MFSAPLLPPAWLETRFGTWSPLAWAFAMLVALGLVFLLRAFGRGDPPSKGEAKTPFVSANPVEKPEDLHIPASHLYWGFLHAMRRYYRRMNVFHSGILSDYVLWFLLGLGVVFIVLQLH